MMSGPLLVLRPSSRGLLRANFVSLPLEITVLFEGLTGNWLVITDHDPTGFSDPRSNRALSVLFCL